MLRRVLSVLQRQSALRRYAFAGTAALGLALACLNPQNDDLPSFSDREGAEITNPNGPDEGDSANESPSDAPSTPEFAPSPQEPGGTQAQPPPAGDPGPLPSSGGDDMSDAPDAGAAPDAASAPDVAP